MLLGLYLERYYLVTVLSPFPHILEKYQITASQLEFIASVNSLAGVVLFIPILGGLMMTKHGMNKIGLIAIVTILLGCILLPIAFLKINGKENHFYTYWMILLCQFISGSGTVLGMGFVLRMILHWFRGEMYAKVMGIISAGLRAGVFVGLFFGPLINSAIGWPAPLIAPLILAILTFILFLYYRYKSDYIGKIHPQYHPKTAISGNSLFDLMVILKSVLRRPRFWLYSVIILSFYGTIYSFLIIAPTYIHQCYGVPIRMASSYSSIIPFMSIFITPIVGLFNGKMGYSLTVSCIGAIFLFCGFMLLLPQSGFFVPIILLGLGLSIGSLSLWLVIANDFHRNHYSVASGALFWFLNFSLWIVPIFVGLIVKGPLSNKYSIHEAVEFLVFFSFFPAVFQLLLFYINSKKKLGLNMKK
ncbi:MAG: nitrate/nitrite transporter [Bacteroidales bacterium]